MASVNFSQEQGDIALIIGQTGIGKSSLIRLFLQIMERIQKHETEIIIIDEAHLVPSQSLTDLRLLVSSGKNLSCKIILSGQEPLAYALNHPVLSQRRSLLRTWSQLKAMFGSNVLNQPILSDLR
ncbi:MAG: hypothetical protein A2097_01720 [Desulfobacula sp. GWF2_41_7]|nr:MAG: hypothetical protein A2097_01720 [Desulfobacula sp. GWF2_41_7]